MDLKMSLYYKSTRNSNMKVTASEAILAGLAPDGGLFVPAYLPKLDVSFDELKNMTEFAKILPIMKKADATNLLQLMDKLTELMTEYNKRTDRMVTFDLEIIQHKLFSGASSNS